MKKKNETMSDQENKFEKGRVIKERKQDNAFPTSNAMNK